MPKKRKKKGTAKQRRAWAKAGRRLKAWSRKHGHGKSKKKRKGKKKGHARAVKVRSGGKKGHKQARRAAAAGVKVPSKAKIQDAYRRIIDRGGSEQHAKAVVARLERMRMHAIRKGMAAHEAQQKAAAEKKHAEDFAAVFRKIGKEEARRASL